MMKNLLRIALGLLVIAAVIAVWLWPKSAGKHTQMAYLLQTGNI